MLVSGHPEGQELTIWDSNESEFASGLEHQSIFRCARILAPRGLTSFQYEAHPNLFMTSIGRQLLTTSPYLPLGLPITLSSYVSSAKLISVTILPGPYASRSRLEGLSFPTSTGWVLTPRYQVHPLPNQ